MNELQKWLMLPFTLTFLGYYTFKNEMAKRKLKKLRKGN